MYEERETLRWMICEALKYFVVCTKKEPTVIQMSHKALAEVFMKDPSPASRTMFDLHGYNGFYGDYCMGMKIVPVARPIGLEEDPLAIDFDVVMYYEGVQIKFKL